MLYGAIFGDIAGSLYEFNAAKGNDFTLVPKGSRFTDDTIMTLAVANWLLTDENLSDDQLVKEMQLFGKKYPRGGYGGMFRKWLVSSDPQPYNSFGNGSAMRVSPCGWVSDDINEVLSTARQSAEVTHNHPEGVKGAQAVAMAIWIARTISQKPNHTPETIKKAIKNGISEIYGYDLNRTIDDIIKSGYRFNETCQGSVPEAIIAVLESTDFESAIRNAIRLKGDADTQACIAGAIAEAIYGIPDEFKQVVESKLDSFLLDIVKQFNEKYK
jgi:ADP-ribosylglycohydrolase